MSGMVVVYEVDEPVTAHGSEGRARGGEVVVRRVHAAPAAPGSTSVPGPRTFCGRDTFAMETASRQPDGGPSPAWYAPEYAGRVCPACDEAVSD